MKHILTVFLSLAILSSLSGCSTNEISQSSSQSASTELSAEGKKNVAESADLQISTAVEMSKNYYDVLSERMDGLETGEFSMLDVYTTCEEMKEYLHEFRDHVDEIEDENADDYKDAAKSYIANIVVIADDVMDYIDNGEMSTLSDIQEGVRLISYCQTMVDEARENLSAQMQRYRAGLTSQLEVNDAISNVNDSDLQYVQAVYDGAIALSDLKFAVGVEVEVYEKENK